MSSKFTPFPTLFPESIDPWRWPSPPFVWQHKEASEDGVVPCRLEARNGDSIEGELVSINPVVGVLSFRRGPEGKVHDLAFSRFCRLTLLEPLEEAPRRPGAPAEMLPVASEQRIYRITLKGSERVLEGFTLGHVESSDGLFLFEPLEGGRALRRVLVPREAYTEVTYGRSSAEIVAERWIATREGLVEALAEQSRKPVLQVGQALVELGFLTQEQLERAIKGPTLDLPLGERVVALGLVSRSDLQTALAYKMGYPFVDLARFPVDASVAKMLPFNTLVQARSLPLMLDGSRLIIAMDRPSRLDLLKGMQAVRAWSFLPVLASKQQLLAALSVLNPNDVWAANEYGLAGYFATTS
jgi:hypothetical protein